LENELSGASVYTGAVVPETSEKWCYHLSVIIQEVYFSLWLNSQKYNNIISNLHFSNCWSSPAASYWLLGFVVPFWL
jgi:hypothetical protein